MKFKRLKADFKTPDGKLKRYVSRAFFNSGEEWFAYTEMEKRFNKDGFTKNDAVNGIETVEVN